MTGTSGASSITVASATGITVGMYVVGTNIPTFTTVTSIASAPSITLSNANSGTITAGTAVKFIPTTGAHISSDGRLFAADATLTGNVTAKSGSFTGNVSIGASGSLYSGTVTAGTPPTLSGAGFILNSSGLRFNSSTVNGITTIDGTTGQFITTSASIGTWTIDSNTINKTTGLGKITLDSGTTSANLAMYATSNDGNYTAGILAAKTASPSTDIAMWAGNVTGPANASNANFRVLHSGDTYVKTLNATGTIISSGGSTQKITIDGLHDLIQMGTNTQLFARSGTTFLSNTALLDGSYALSQTALNAAEYLAIGSSTNSFGKTMAGIGLYAPNAYINVTASNGIGISTVNVSSGSTYNANQILLSSGQLKLNSGQTTISGGLETNTNISSQILLDSQTITMQTWNSAVTPSQESSTAGSKIVLSQGSVSIGARDNTTTGKITVGSNSVLTETSTYNFMVVGSVAGLGTRLGGSAYNTLGIGSSNNTIVLQANASRINGINSAAEGVSAYAGPSRITVDETYGVGIWGLPVQGNTIKNKTGTDISIMYEDSGPYAGASPLGPLPRQRVLVEDPVSGQVKLGMAVYYQDMTGLSTSNPTYTSGYVGDLWVQF